MTSASMLLASLMMACIMILVSANDLSINVLGIIGGGLQHDPSQRE